MVSSKTARRIKREFMDSKSGFRLTGSLLVLMLLLAGCGGDGNNDEAEEASDSQSTAAQEDTTNAESASSSPDTMTEPVEVTISAARQENRRLVVTGETNLPDGTEVLVIVERNGSRISWRSRVDVQNRGFEAGPLGPESGMPDGEYTITFRMSPPGVQPRAVQQIIGDRGQHLSGPLVTDSQYEGAVATYTTNYTAGN